MQAHGNAHHVDRQYVAHVAFHSDHRAIGHCANEVGETVDIGSVHAAGNCYPVHDQRAFVEAAAHQPLHRLKAVEVVALECTLNALGRQAADVLLYPPRLRRYCHFLVGVEDGGIRARRAPEIRIFGLIGDVHLRGVDGHRDLVRRRFQLGKHVAGIVSQPLGGLAFVLGGEGDGTANLNDHFRHRLAHAGDQFVEHGQALAAPAIEFAHMQMQHRGPRVVAVHRLLDLVFHRDRDVLRKVSRQPTRCIGRSRNDQRLLVFGKKVAVEEIHGGSPRGRAAVGSVGNVARLAFAGRLVRGPARQRHAGAGHPLRAYVCVIRLRSGGLSICGSRNQRLLIRDIHLLIRDKVPAPAMEPSLATMPKVWAISAYQIRGALRANAPMKSPCEVWTGRCRAPQLSRSARFCRAKQSARRSEPTESDRRPFQSRAAASKQVGPGTRKRNQHLE